MLAVLPVDESHESLPSVNMYEVTVRSVRALCFLTLVVVKGLEDKANGKVTF